MVARSPQSHHPDMLVRIRRFRSVPQKRFRASRNTERIEVGSRKAYAKAGPFARGHGGLPRGWNRQQCRGCLAVCSRPAYKAIPRDLPYHLSCIFPSFAQHDDFASHS